MHGMTQARFANGSASQFRQRRRSLLRRLPTALALSALVFVFVLLLAAPVEATPPNEPNEADVRRLIEQLDDDSYEVRRRAQRELIAIGEPALPAVRAAIDSSSAEVRTRVRDIARQIEHDRLLRAFHKLSATDDAALDVEQGLLLAAQIIDPAADAKQAIDALDALAERVRQRIAARPDEQGPLSAVDALCHVLFVEEGFDGNRGDYDNPINSSIHHVLATKRGLPILLSQVVIAVGRRADIPLVGLALPGRFMVKYDGPQIGDQGQAADVIIDPFDQGKRLTVPQLQAMFPENAGIDQLLQPADGRMTLVRVLNNLWNAYGTREDFRRLAEVGAYREALLRSAASAEQP